MTILELAAEFGDAIAKEDAIKKYNAAKAAYEGCVELKDALYEYETQRSILASEVEKDPDQQNSGLIALARERMEDLAKTIVAFEEYRDYQAAGQEVNRLMQEINTTISARVFGESCTHDCSTCRSACANRN